MDLEATDASLMTTQDFLQLPSHKIPDSEGSVTGTGYGCLGVGHFEAPYSGCMTAKGMDTRTKRVSLPTTQVATKELTL